MTIDHNYIINRARAFMSMHVTGPVDFKDADILRCLSEETLPTFSIYMPDYRDFTIDTIADQLPGREGVYQIRTHGERLLAVNQIREGVGTFGSFPYDPLMFGDVLDRQLVADRMSATEVRITFDFRAPNIVEIFPKGLTFSNITAQCKIIHAEHLRTIPPTAREILRELFLADLAIDLLGTRSYFAQLNTVFGEIQLNLDSIRAQAEKRDSIIEKLETKQLKTSHAKRLWIA